MSGVGGRFHEQCLLDPTEDSLRGFGFETYRNVQAGRGHVDMLALRGSTRIVVEAELSAKRINGDLNKAMHLEATELWIVTPTPLLAGVIQRKLRRLGITPNTNGVFVLILPKVRQRLTECFSLIAGANKGEKTNEYPHQRTTPGSHTTGSPTFTPARGSAAPGSFAPGNAASGNIAANHSGISTPTGSPLPWKSNGTT